MDTFKTTGTISKDGVLTLNDLPFAEGIEVEVTVQRQPDGYVRMEVDPNDLSRPALHNPNKGTVIWYHDPFEPAIPEEEWEMLAGGSPVGSGESRGSGLSRAIFIDTSWIHTSKSGGSTKSVA